MCSLSQSHNRLAVERGRRKHLALICCVGVWILPMMRAIAADEAEKSQKQGIERLDRYREYFYKTGNRDSLLSELNLAESELRSSYSAFVARGDFSAAASSEIGLARIENIRSVEGLSITGKEHGVNIAAAEPIEAHDDAAFRLYTTARELAKKAGDASKEAEALVGIAKTDGLSRGNVSDGLDDATEAIRLATKAGAIDGQVDALDMAAELELKRGRLAAAIEYLDRAIAMSAKVEKKVSLYFVYTHRSDVYRQRMDICVTEPRFEVCYQALKLARENLQRARGVCQELGYEFLAQQAVRAASDLDTLQSLLQQQEQTSKKYAEYFSPKAPKDVLVTDHFAAGASPEHLAQIKKVLEQYPGLSVIPGPTSYYVQGLMREMEGNNEAALAAFQKSVDLLERDRRRLRDDQSRGTFLEDKIELYYAPIKLLLDQHRMGEAFDLMERSRSRGMADLLTSRPLNLGSGREQELFSEQQQLRAQIAAEQQKLFRFSAAGGSEKHSEEIAQSQAKIGELERDYQSLSTRIATEAPRLSQLTESRTVRLEDFQKWMRQENCDVLYYLALPTGIILWHISGDDVKAVSVFLPRPYLIDKVLKLRKSLTDRAQDPDTAFDEQASRELFLFLIQPVLKSIKTQHLVIVPHEDLNYVPFQALRDPADGTFLGEKFQISYAPSATVLDSLKETPNVAGGKLLAVANPSIEAARTEVKAIGSLYPGRSKVVADAPVTKDEVRTWAAGYNLLHLSVHGRFDESDPLLSYLELNPSGKENGRMTAAEMFGLPLSKRSMVVLSACETGRVTATHANEILGMERALLYAGASELVLSSWEVDAGSTALWMQTFYREAQTKSASEAARLALLAVKARPEYSHPYFWSPFLLTGN